MGEIIKGRAIAEAIYQECRDELSELLREHGASPCLAIITAGYENLKQREIALHADIAERLGIATTAIALDDDASEEQLIASILRANADPSVHGILVLLPLPDDFDQEKILQAIAPEKELEGLRAADSDRPLPAGKQPSTMAAVFALLREVNFNIVSGRAVLIIDDSILDGNAVVSHLVALAETLNLPLDVAKTSDPDAKMVTTSADVLLVSVSTPSYIDSTFIKSGAVVIDFNPIAVGEAFSQTKQRFLPILRSGVDIDSVLPRAHYVAPAVGGVGPIALAMMMKNFVINFRSLLESGVTVR